MAQRHEIQALYRSYLRLVRDWPADKVRPERDMKQVLAQRVEETFRRPLENEHEPFDVASAKRQLVALEKLLNNEFKNKVLFSKRRSSKHKGCIDNKNSTLCRTRSCRQPVTRITMRVSYPLLELQRIRKGKTLWQGFLVVNNDHLFFSITLKKNDLLCCFYLFGSNHLFRANPFVELLLSKDAQ